MHFETLLFDFDYTLADSSEGIVLCFNHALVAMGHDARTPDQIRATIGLSLQESYAALTGDDSPDQAQRFVDLYVPEGDRILLDHTYLLPRVSEGLTILHWAGYPMGVLSTKYSYRIVPVLEQHDLLSYFQVVLGGEHVSHFKPDPEGLYIAMERMRSRRESTLYVGDSTTDGRACRRAGVAFAAVLSGVTPRAALEALDPWIVVDDVYDLALQLTGRKEGGA